jgi:hypothetical protein
VRVSTVFGDVGQISSWYGDSDKHGIDTRLSEGASLIGDVKVELDVKIELKMSWNVELVDEGEEVHVGVLNDEQRKQNFSKFSSLSTWSKTRAISEG